MALAASELAAMGNVLAASGEEPGNPGGQTLVHAGAGISVNDADPINPVVTNTGVRGVTAADSSITVGGTANNPTLSAHGATQVVATEAALLALDCTSITEGTACVVESLRCIWDLLPSTKPVVAFVNVAALNKAGFQWVRRLIRNPLWEVETTWYVDPQNGSASDDNTGLASNLPLATLTELSRRLTDAVLATGVLVTVNLLSDCVNTDKPVWTFAVQDGATSGDGLSIVGTPGAALYSGTVTSFVQQTQGNVGAADDNQLHDTGIPVSYTASGLVATGMIYKRTNSTALYAYPLLDLGTKTVRTSDFCTAAGAITALAANDTYSVLPLPKVYDQSFLMRSTGRVASRVTLTLVDDRSTQTASTGVFPLESATYDRCTRSTTWTLTNQVLLNAALWGAGSGINGPGTVLMRNGAVIGTGATVFNVINGGTLAGSGSGPVHFQGCSLACAQQGMLNMVIVCSYNCTGDCIQLQNSQAFLNALKGKGNSGNLMNAEHGACLVYNHTVVPPALDASTSLGTAFKAGNTSVAAAGLPNVSANYMAGIVASQ